AGRADLARRAPSKTCRPCPRLCPNSSSTFPPKRGRDRPLFVSQNHPTEQQRRLQVPAIKHERPSFGTDAQQVSFGTLTTSRRLPCRPSPFRLPPSTCRGQISERNPDKW